MAYDFNSLIKQADEASNRDKFYTDFEDVDPNVLHQISELTDWMRTKAKGSDVREVIAQLFERTWLEESKEGNANMEVAKARGRFPVLNDRLNNADMERAENARKLAQKANKDEVTNVMTPKGTLAYASLPMTGNSVGWYYYCPDGDGTHGAGNYVWNGKSWFFGGTGDQGYNLLKKDLSQITGCERIIEWSKPYHYLNTNGSTVDTSDVIPSSTAWVYAVIDCVTGEQFTINGTGGSAPRLWCFTDAEYNVLSVSAESAEAVNLIITAPENAAHLIINDKGNGVSYRGIFVQDAIAKAAENLKAADVSYKAVPHGFLLDHNSKDLWEQGHIKKADGTNGASTAELFATRIRTGYIDEEISAIRIANTDYSLALFVYDLDGNFVSYADNVSDTVLLDHDNYKYRLALHHPNASGGDYFISVTEYDACMLLLASYKNVNLYSRNANWGNVGYLNGYYKGLNGDYSQFVRSTLSETIYSKFDELHAANSSYITKTDLGASSDNSHLYAYDFKPKFIGNAKKDLIKIIIISGQHGFEKSSVYGLYYLMYDIVHNWTESSILDYLRNNVEFLVVPIVNRYGFDNNEYKNANGVNLNRNYDFNFTPGSDTTSSSYGGAEAFSELETKIVRDLVLSNTDAFMFIDWHTNGKYAVSKYTDINWLSLTPKTFVDTYLSGIIDAAAFHIPNITAHFEKDYNLNTLGDSLCGYIDKGNAGQSTAKGWVESKGIMSMTFESFNGFPTEESAMSANAQKANSELMGNWLATLISTFANNY